jgi:hypothetical protein
MKTLIILSAFLLVLSSCNKDMPVPDTDTDQSYYSDSGQGSDDDQGQDPDDGDSDDGSDNDDPSNSCSTVHLGRTATQPGQAR